MSELFTEKYGAKSVGADFSPIETPAVISHTIIYGPEGSGKFSLANAWLREKFGTDVAKMKRKTWECSLPSKCKPMEVVMLCSGVHYVLDPTGWGQQDRNVLSKFMKDTCMGGNVGQFLEKSRQKIVVIRNAEILTAAAQKILRYLLDELQTPACSVVMLTNALFKLQPALISRCHIIKRETDPLEMERALLSICRKEDIQASEGDCREIAKISRGSWRSALNTLQMIALKRRDRLSITQIATRKLLGNLDPRGIVREEVVSNIRKDAYTCLTICGVHRPGLVLTNCIRELINSGLVEDCQRVTILRMAWEVDTLMSRGTRPVLHIERFLMLLWDSGIADAYVHQNGSFTSE